MNDNDSEWLCVNVQCKLLIFNLISFNTVCNTNTTTNTNEIKALTRIESEQTAWKYANSVAMGSYTKCLYMSIYCSCWSGGSIVWSTHWNITYTPGTYLLQHVTTVSCRCFSSKFYLQFNIPTLYIFFDHSHFSTKLWIFQQSASRVWTDAEWRFAMGIFLVYANPSNQFGGNKEAVRLYVT